MIVKILGTRGNIKPTAPRHTRHSGVLLNNELLLDFGEGAYARHNPRWILLTHLHPDHACFVSAPLPTRPEVMAPDPHPGARTTPVKPWRRFQLDGWRVMAIPTVHSQHLRSVAYRVTRSGKSLLYTGDLVDFASGALARVGRVDLVITEGSFFRRGGLVRRDPRTGRRFGHAGLADLVRQLARLTPRIIVTHLGSWFYRDPAGARRKVRGLGRMHGVEARIAWDGITINL
ncbi:MAG: MBL fold metallo-hydrolase [Gemmatimonadales bacterium]